MLNFPDEFEFKNSSKKPDPFVMFNDYLQLDQ